MSYQPTNSQREHCERKVRFATLGEAAAELERTRRKAANGETRRRECRAYPCLVCFGYHLTSQPLHPQGRGTYPLREDPRL